MIKSNQPETEARRTLALLLPRIERELKRSITKEPLIWDEFKTRLKQHFPKLLAAYADIYSFRFDFFYHLEDLITNMARLWFKRPPDLRGLDVSREGQPDWFQSNQTLGGICYVDRFAKNLEGICKKIPYFKELGLTYLHLMPLFKMPEDENDGGYAVSSYREVHPPLGTMKQLASLARDLREAGISLALDLVFNHTSDEHIWAEKAKQGDEEFMDFYRIFPDREMPDLYEQTLREIFPEEHLGAFTSFTPKPLTAEAEGISSKEIDREWVWTTFHSYQWDLNYANPSVFNRMAEEMLFLANQGVEVLRLDAVAFIWKQIGTSCENLPQAHTLIQAFNAVARIAAPALIFKSEAIVHPDDVVKYISPDECQTSYNPLLMALVWESLATRKIQLLSKALQERFQIHPDTAWVNYVRVHDDIGWTFSDEDAAEIGINARDHRSFLNEFYRGRFPGSFARGIPFQENPKTGDCRISGTCASLAGLEKAVSEEGDQETEFAIRRILLMYGIVMTVGGIPLIYLGDEIGTMNDYGYRYHSAHQHDSRWVHRSKADWKRYAKRNDPSSLEGRVYLGFQNLIKLRKENEDLSCGPLSVIPTGNEHVLAFSRKNLVVAANFSESLQEIPYHILAEWLGMNSSKIHGLSGFSHGNVLILEPLDFLVTKQQS